MKQRVFAMVGAAILLPLPVSPAAAENRNGGYVALDVQLLIGTLKAVGRAKAILRPEQLAMRAAVPEDVGLRAEPTSPHGSRFLNLQPTMAHIQPRLLSKFIDKPAIRG